MPYLIDSDWVIDHLEGLPEAVQLLRDLAPDGLAISIISYIEVYQGVMRSPRPDEARASFEALMATLIRLDVSVEVAQRCAHVRETLRRQGRRVNSRALDLIIAATALEHDLTLVTRNTDDYRDIPGLHIYQST
jgi:tRNA(fMet)-specific endonuclease VapC